MSCYLEQTVTEQELMEAQPYEVLNFHRSTLSPNVTSCVCRALYTCLDAIYSPMAPRRLYWFYMNTINVMVEIYQKYFYCYCVKGIQ